MDRIDTTHKESAALLDKIKQTLKEHAPSEYLDLAKNVNFMRSREPFAQWLYTFVLADQENAGDFIEKKPISSASDTTAYVPMIDQIKKLIMSNPDALTEFGKLIQRKVHEGTLVDLGAGDKEAPGIERWAEIFEAKEYVGIDLGEEEGAYQHGNTRNYRLKQDNLILISRLPESSVSMFHIAGIERDENFDNNQIHIYFECLIKEMKRALKPGGIIVVGPGCDFLLYHKDRNLFKKSGLEQSLKVSNDEGGHPTTIAYMHTYAVYQKKE